jgi:large subunit ribosomal protein L23
LKEETRETENIENIRGVEIKEKKTKEIPSFASSSVKTSADKKASAGKKEVKEPKEAPVVSRKKKKVERELAFRVLKSPHITEKVTNLNRMNQYAFKVYPNVNKTEIKKAIEELYNVDVLSVKIIRVPAKKRTMKRISGWRSGYKKAIIKIREGQKIEGLI